MQTCPGSFLKSLLECPGNLLEICSVKFVDTLIEIWDIRSACLSRYRSGLIGYIIDRKPIVSVPIYLFI